MLSPAESGIYLDATLGGGGHARELLQRTGPKSVVIGMDRDQESLSRAKEYLNDVRMRYLHARFSEMAQRLREMGYSGFDGIIMDLGISMIQLKDQERGFSFHSDAPLDMRMDRSQRLTAEEIVNRWPERDILRILKEYGEERKAVRIARAIVNERRRSRICTCLQLAGLIERVYGRWGRIHPATKTFQALRIAVNSELSELNEGIKNSVMLLNKNGRLCVITYHSLEDRIVKKSLLGYEKEGLIRRLNKKPLTPGREERTKNPSSRSAKLRGVAKI